MIQGANIATAKADIAGMKMRCSTDKVTIIFALAAALFLPTTSATSASCPAPAKSIASQGEIAIEVRRLQTTLMVAALSCNARSYYNDFVKKYRPRLQHYGKAIRIEFRRRYGQDGAKELNRFVTHLANKASARSNANRATFCSEALTFFQQAAARDAVLASIVTEPINENHTTLVTCETPTGARLKLRADEFTAQNR
jgi:hypothetical protein